MLLTRLFKTGLLDNAILRVFVGLAIMGYELQNHALQIILWYM